MFYLSVNQKYVTLKFEYVLVQYPCWFGENNRKALKSEKNKL